MQKNSMGLQENIAGLLCYFGFWVTGIIFIILKPNNKTVRFHAFQSAIVFGALNLAYYVFWFVPFFDWIINILLGALTFIIWVVLIVRTYQGQKWKLPVIGNLAEKWTNR
jgi:uncharacterized membrane protein